MSDERGPAVEQYGKLANGCPRDRFRLQSRTSVGFVNLYWWY